MFFAYLITILCSSFLFSYAICQEISYDTAFKQIQQMEELWLGQFGILHKENHFNFWISKYKEAMANGITNFVLDADLFIDDINLIKSYAEKHNIPFAFYINPDTLSQNSLNLLESNGFAKANVYIMVHYLSDIPETNSQDYEIKPILEQQIGEWLNVVRRVFGENDANCTKALSQEIKKSVNNCGIVAEYYATTINSKIVSIGTIFIHNGWGYIANIATDPDYRKKGIATSLMGILLKRSVQLDLKYVLLTASDAASLYERIGFKKMPVLYFSFIA